MSKITLKLYKKTNVWLLPLLLLVVSAVSVFECYIDGTSWGMGTLFFFYATTLFVVFDYILPRGAKGTLIYLLLFAVIMLISFNAVSSASSDISFVNWFYLTVENNASSPPEYLFALFLGGGFFFTFVVYYFTQIRYRSVAMLLILFIPFVIYAKRQDTMSDLRITLLITLYLAVLVHNRLLSSETKKIRISTCLPYCIAIGFFVSFVGAVSMFVPDFSEESLLEQNSDLFGSNATKISSSDIGEVTNWSADSHGAEYTNEEIFSFTTDAEGPIYLRRQSYTHYSPDEELWYLAQEIDDATIFDPSVVSFSFEYNFLQQLYAINFDSVLYIPVADSVLDVSVTPTVRYAYINLPEGVNSKIIPCPLYSISDNQTYFELGDVFYSDNSYNSISYDFYDDSDKAEEFASQYNSHYDTYGDMLNSSENLFGDNIDLEYQCQELYNRNYEAVYYYRYISEDLFDYNRIKSLADEITDGCENDYEKAKAIEQYFTDNDFEYDLEYVPAGSSLSYFLFESKRGICADFATAMTVLCKMEDIPARYVEGYLAYEKSEDTPNTFIVRDSHSHAFSEVYVAGAGWITFEPTVAGYMQDFSSDNSGSVATFLREFGIVFGRLLIFIGVIFVAIFFVLFDRICEALFRIRMKFGSFDVKIKRLYKHTIHVLEYADRNNLKPYTSEMLNDYVLKKCGRSITQLCETFDEMYFGSISVSSQQFSNAYDEYKSVYKYLRKPTWMKKRKRAKS